MDIYNPNDFIFSKKYHVLRHMVFWVGQILFFATITYLQVRGHRDSFWLNVVAMLFWVPINMLYTYSLIYWVLPKYVLKEKHLPSIFLILAGLIGAYFFNYLFRAYVFIPLQDALYWKNINRNPWMGGSFLYSLTTASAAGIIVLFRHWIKKQQEWLQAQKEKVTAELQLLKAQVHPHFLFNTLNNIYSFSLENSPKTPGLILKLSSLLSYMLYDCKGDEVLLEKEIEVMKAYIDLEKERYGNKIEISLNIEGDIKDQYIAPLLLLPFIENAFKHGTSEQLDKPWLSMDIAVKQHTLRCKIVNSKNEAVPVSEKGIGIYNVKKRLHFLYPNKHELKMADEGDFFVVSLLLQLADIKMARSNSSVVYVPVAEKV